MMQVSVKSLLPLGALYTVQSEKMMQWHQDPGSVFYLHCSQKQFVLIVGANKLN
jgi:hypothetical protein